MSSIYRKGRDGYYYYQTYVHNPDTGKKSKRIFHSLGTRNLEEAKKKQAKLDIKYEKDLSNELQKPFILRMIKKYKSVGLVVTSIVFTVIVMKKLESVPVSKSEILTNTKNIEFQKIENTPIIKSDIEKKKYHAPNKSDVTQDSLVITKSKILKEKIHNKIPEYQIVRIDPGSEAFNQGKIYATVPKNTKSTILLQICKQIVDKNKEFSNLVICLYEDSEAGFDIAQGKVFNYSNEQIKRSWLVMYSYNPVEGEYFDDNPGGYLGAF